MGPRTQQGSWKQESRHSSKGGIPENHAPVMCLWAVYTYTLLYVPLTPRLSGSLLVAVFNILSLRFLRKSSSGCPCTMDVDDHEQKNVDSQLSFVSTWMIHKELHVNDVMNLKTR